MFTSNLIAVLVPDGEYNTTFPFLIAKPVETVTLVLTNGVATSRVIFNLEFSIRQLILLMPKKDEFTLKKEFWQDDIYCKSSFVTDAENSAGILYGKNT